MHYGFQTRIERGKNARGHRNKNNGLKRRRLPPRAVICEIVSKSQAQTMRKRHGKSTAILISIVIIFIICHSFRMSIRVFEIVFPESTVMVAFHFCLKMGKFHMPLAMMFLAELNYFFLVLNSSVNFLIYCCVSQEFRRKLLQLFCRKFN
jgi:hypothetical protein